jgi:hypothetical protein
MLITITIIIMNFVGLGNNAWKPIQGTDIVSAGRMEREGYESVLKRVIAVF